MDEHNHTPNFRPEGWVILAVLMTWLSATLAIFAYPAERVLFNPEVYKRVLVSQEVYSYYPQMMIDLLASQGETILPGSGAVFQQMLDRTGYQEAVLQIFPPTWAREQTESLVDQLLAFFNLEKEELVLVVDFRPVKQRLRGDEAAVIAQTIVMGFSPCSGEELLAFGLNILQGQMADVPLCRPPDQLLGITTSIVQGVLQVSAATLPDQPNFARILRLPLILGGQRLEGVLSGWQWFYRAFRIAGPWLPLAAVVSVALVVVLARGTRRGPFFWSGLGLAVPGMAGAVMTIFISLFALRPAAELLERIFPPELLLSQLLLQVYAEVVGRFALTTAVISVLLVVLGVLLLGAALWTRYAGKRA
jgi:hypothetical protein